tara:strand:- start:112 stop:252 length:141 start_codon:yes stop_codon:yes gene_type:complete
MMWKHFVILGTHVKTTHQLCEGQFGFAAGVALNKSSAANWQLQPMV